MATEGIEAVFLETHNWGKSARFFQSLGYELEFEDSFVDPSNSSTLLSLALL